MEKIIVIEKKITFFLNNLLPHNYFFNYIFSFLSLKGSFVIILILLIIFILILTENKKIGIHKRNRKFMITLILAFFITIFGVEFFLKNFFQRLRPQFTNHNQQLTISSCPTDFSFPSGHAATAFAAATVLAYFDKKRRFFYYSIATLIAYSRIYLGCHYFFDVIGGGMIGFIIARLLIKLMSERN